MVPLRILVLTSSTGGGHDARAVAFERWVKRLYGWSVDVRVESMLEDSSMVARFGVYFYNFIQKHAPWMHHPYYLLIELFGAFNRRGVALGRRYYRQVVENFQPHLVFSVHDCLNRGYFQEARSILGKNKVRCATFCSEFSGGYGYSQNWIDPTVDLYLSRTRTAADYAEKLGLAPDRIRVRGHLMEPRVYDETLADETERARFREQVLGLRRDRFTVFLATGGAGANNHLALLPVLRGLADTHQAIVVCGRNHKAFLKVNQWRKENPGLLCHVEGYCNRMHLLVQACDAIVTRGGTTTCAKALHYGCPILLNGMGGIMPQERLTTKFFVQDKAAVIVSDADDLERVLRQWQEDPEAYAEQRRRLLALRYEEEPTGVIRELIDLAREASMGAYEEPVEHVI